MKIRPAKNMCRVLISRKDPPDLFGWQPVWVAHLSWTENIQHFIRCCWFSCGPLLLLSTCPKSYFLMFNMLAGSELIGLDPCWYFLVSLALSIWFRQAPKRSKRQKWKKSESFDIFPEGSPWKSWLKIAWKGDGRVFSLANSIRTLPICLVLPFWRFHVWGPFWVWALKLSGLLAHLFLFFVWIILSGFVVSAFLKKTCDCCSVGLRRANRQPLLPSALGGVVRCYSSF